MGVFLWPEPKPVDSGVLLYGLLSLVHRFGDENLCLVRDLGGEDDGDSVSVQEVDVGGGGYF